VHTGLWQGDLRGRDHLDDRRRWKDNIKMDIQKVGWRDMDWTDLAEDRESWQAVVMKVMNFLVP
jgi:hypothetical protein